MSDHSIQLERIKTASREGIAECYDSVTKITTAINFNDYGFSKEYAKAYAFAYQHCYCDASNRSHTTNIRILIQLCRIHQDLKITRLNQMNTQQIREIISWLKSKPGIRTKVRSTSFNYQIFGLFRRLVKTIPQSKSRAISEIRWPSNPFPNKNKSNKKVSTPSKSIFEATSLAMLKEIQKYENRITEGREILLRETSNESNLAAIIVDIKANEKAYFSGKYPKSQSPIDKWQIKSGGIKYIRSYLYPTREYISSVYLYILMHSGANPASLLAIKTDCIKEVPLLKSQSNLVVPKRRGYKEYSIQLSRSGRASPIRILEFLIGLIADMKTLGLTSSNYIFQELCTSKGLKTIGQPSNDRALISTTNTVLKNKGVETQPPSSWRKSHLTELYKHSQDIAVVKREANHSDVRTTERYIDESIQSQQISTALVSLTQLHVDYLKNKSKLMFAGDVKKRNDSNLYKTTMGSKCKDPKAGVAPGSKPKELCPGFLRCFTCENCVIVINLETCVRLIHTKDHIKEAKKDMHPDRWEVVYQPILKIIQYQILKNFPKAMKEKAGVMSNSLDPLPRLT